MSKGAPLNNESQAATPSPTTLYQGKIAAQVTSAKRQLDRVCAELNLLEADLCEPQGKTTGQMTDAVVKRMEQLILRETALRKHLLAIDETNTHKQTIFNLTTAINQTEDPPSGVNESTEAKDQGTTQQSTLLTASGVSHLVDEAEANFLASVNRNMSSEVDCSRLIRAVAKLDFAIESALDRIAILFEDGMCHDPSEFHLHVKDEEIAIHFLIRTKNAVLLRVISLAGLESARLATETLRDAKLVSTEFDRNVLGNDLIPPCDLMMRRIQACLDAASAALSQMESNPRDRFEYALRHSWVQDAEFEDRYKELSQDMRLQHSLGANRFLQVQRVRLRVAHRVERLKASDRLLTVLSTLEDCKNQLFGMVTDDTAVQSLLRTASVAVAVYERFEQGHLRTTEEERRDMQRELIAASKRTDALATLAKRSMANELVALNDDVSSCRKRLSVTNEVRQRLHELRHSKRSKPEELTSAELVHALTELNSTVLSAAFDMEDLSSISELKSSAFAPVYDNGTVENFRYADVRIEAMAVAKCWHISNLDSALKTAGMTTKSDVVDALQVAFGSDGEGGTSVDDELRLALAELETLQSPVTLASSAPGARDLD